MLLLSQVVARAMILVVVIIQFILAVRTVLLTSEKICTVCYYMRSIEWSLRASASMQAVFFFIFASTGI